MFFDDEPGTMGGGMDGGMADGAAGGNGGEEKDGAAM